MFCWKRQGTKPNEPEAGPKCGTCDRRDSLERVEIEYWHGPGFGICGHEKALLMCPRCRADNRERYEQMMREARIRERDRATW
jgi:hypothetical protein